MKSFLRGEEQSEALCEESNRLSVTVAPATVDNPVPRNFGTTVTKFRGGFIHFLLTKFKMKNEFEKEYDSLVSQYVSKRSFFPSPKGEIIECLKEIGVENKKILDLGCGDGAHAKKIIEMGAKSVIGIDISSNFIEIAKLRNLSNCQFIVADGSQIPLTDNLVDVVFSNYVIHYFYDTSKVFSEISRVLKSN